MARSHCSFDQELLIRYILLLVAWQCVIGLLPGDHGVYGVLRTATARILWAQRCQQYMGGVPRDRAAAGFWIQLKDGGRIEGAVLAASDSMGERAIVLNAPKSVTPGGQLVPMNLASVMLQGEDCLLIGEVLPSDLPKRT